MDNDGEDSERPAEDPVAMWATLHLEASVYEKRTPNSQEPPAVTTLHPEGAKRPIRSPTAASLYWGRGAAQPALAKRFTPNLSCRFL